MGKKLKQSAIAAQVFHVLILLIYDQLKQTHKLDLIPCLRKLRAANDLLIEVKGVVRVPVVIGLKLYEHDFFVLDKSEADCLVGLDFLETNKCDPLFFCMKLQLDSNNFVPLYHREYEYGHDNVFRVISTETLSIPAGHTRIISAHTPNWKRPPLQVYVLFEPKVKFEPNNEVTAHNIFFDFTGEVIPIAIDNKTEEEITIYKNTTLGFP